MTNGNENRKIVYDLQYIRYLMSNIKNTGRNLKNKFRPV